MGVTRQTNFASASKRPVLAVGMVLWALALAVGAVLVVALSDVVQIRADTAQTADHTARLEDQIGTLRQSAEGAPELGRLSEQAERVRFFNGLTGARRLSMPSVLALLEEQLPSDVWVSQLSYSAETGRLSVSVRTAQETAMPPALRALESDARLADVILERQVRLQQGGNQLVQYDIEAVTR